MGSLNRFQLQPDSRWYDTWTGYTYTTEHINSGQFQQYATHRAWWTPSGTTARSQERKTPE